MSYRTTWITFLCYIDTVVFAISEVKSRIAGQELFGIRSVRASLVPNATISGTGSSYEVDTKNNRRYVKSDVQLASTRLKLTSTAHRDQMCKQQTFRPAF